MDAAHFEQRGARSGGLDGRHGEENLMEEYFVRIPNIVEDSSTAVKESRLPGNSPATRAPIGNRMSRERRPGEANADMSSGIRGDPFENGAPVGRRDRRVTSGSGRAQI